MILVVNNYQDYPIMGLREALDKCGVKYRLKNGNECMDTAELSEYNGIILSGGPGHVTSPMIFEEFRLNVQLMIYADVPILGICFGHQIMAKVSGVNIGQWEGTHFYRKRKIKILENTELFAGFKKGAVIEALVAHRDYVADIPPNAVLTASAESAHASEMQTGVEPLLIDLFGKEAATLMELTTRMEIPTKIQALAYRGRRFYSTQFHPELSGQAGLKILNNFFGICSLEPRAEFH